MTEGVFMSPLSFRGGAAEPGTHCAKFADRRSSAIGSRFSLREPRNDSPVQKRADTVPSAMRASERLAGRRATSASADLLQTKKDERGQSVENREAIPDQCPMFLIRGLDEASSGNQRNAAKLAGAADPAV